MTAKFSQARRNAYLTAFRATGNQTHAAERAKQPLDLDQNQRHSA